MIADQSAAMCREPVPDDQQRTVDPADQGFEEVDHLGALDRAGIEAEVETPERQAGHGGQGLPIEVVLEHRSLSAWRPGPAAVRPLTQSAFVDEDDRTALLAGFFLIAGH